MYNAAVSRTCAAAALLLLAVVCTAQTPSGVASGSIQTYSISWGDISKDHSKDLASTCACDLTRSSCDLNCCCDSDCGSEVVSAFKQSHSCLHEGQQLGELDYCIDASEVSKVNIPSSSGYFTVTKKDAEQDFMSQLLCVVTDRNPDLGAKYADPVAKDADVAKLQSLCSASTQSSGWRGSAYQLQGTLHTQYTFNTQTIKELFTLPAPAFSSACENVQRIGFMTPLPRTGEEMFSTCSYDVSTAAALQAACSQSTVSAPRYMAAAYATSPSDTTYSVTTKLVRLQTLDLATMDITSNPLTTVLPAPVFDSATGTCKNMVQQAIFTFYYNPAGTLQTSSPVELSIVLADVSLASAASVQQRIRVAWVPAGLAGSSAEAFSGNPGYIASYPLLAGVLASNADGATAVQRYFEGFPFPVAGSQGLCAASASTPLRFATNATSSCLLKMTKAQLGAWCSKGAAAIAAALVGDMYNDLVASKVVLGIWGNSVHSDISEWIKVSAAAPGAEPSWDSTAGTCMNVPTGLNIRILTGLADAAATPKQKLLAATACFSVGTWTFTRSDATTAQTFVVQHNTKFTAIAQDPAAMARRHVPPLVPNLPKDLLYPFLD